MKLPVFELLNVHDEKIASTKVLGKYTLVDFWATWCVPCRKETPNLIDAYNKYHSVGFNIITVSLDSKSDRKKWEEVLAKDNMTKFTNLFNGGDESGLARQLKITTIPANYLVDDKGVIVATNLRGDGLRLALEEMYGTTK